MSIDTETRDGFHDHLPEEARELDAPFVDAYRGLWRAATRRGALSAAERELIGLAVNAAVTNLYFPAIRRHVRAAIDAGATRTQILEALELTSVLGIHTITVGLPVILEELGVDTSGEYTEQQEALKADFMERRGSWSPLWDSLVKVDPDFFVAYTDFSGAPWDHEQDGLSPKMREFVYVAIDSCTNHLMVPGIRAHAANAIRYGATLEELLEVLELTCLIGMQTFVEGATEYLAATAEG